MVIKFRDFSVDLHRDESSVQVVFEQALRQAAAQGDERLPLQELQWTSDRVILSFEDEAALRYGILLTFDKWFQVLKELLSFSRHYRRVNFRFEVFDYTLGEEMYTGIGRLS